MLASPTGSTPASDLSVPVAPGIALDGILKRPHDARGLVVFVHGSGSSRFSPRNRFVAERFAANGLATLLTDLLTPDEEAEDAVTRALRFDIDLLVKRVVATIDWLRDIDDLARLPIGLFGASTGAAAALIAASLRPDAVRAVVSRGGRPDLADKHLQRVRAPTLLIVGGDDRQVLALNREALANLRSEKDLIVVPHATHLFEEPGALEQVAQHAMQWFAKHLAATSVAGGGQAAQ
jgi:putative phosphoribosyl transferase